MDAALSQPARPLARATRPAASSRARLHTRAVAVAATPEEGKPARSYSSTRSKSSTAAPASPKPEAKEVKVQFEELAVGKSFKGVVNNLATYGAFIDIGAASNGLAHISQLSTEFVGDITTVLTVGQEVEAYVVAVDEATKRFSLSLLAPGVAEASAAAAAAASPGGEAAAAPRPRVATRGVLKARDAEGAAAKTLSAKRGDWVEGTVKSVMVFGAIVEVEEGVSGLLHVTEMSEKPDAKAEELVKVGQTVRVRIDKVEKAAGAEKIRLSMLETFDLKAMNAAIQIPSGMTAVAYAFAKAGFVNGQPPARKLSPAATAAAAAAAAAAKAEAEAAAAAAEAAARAEEEAKAAAAAKAEAEAKAEAQAKAEAAKAKAAAEAAAAAAAAEAQAQAEAKAALAAAEAAAAAAAAEAKAQAEAEAAAAAAEVQAAAAAAEAKAQAEAQAAAAAAEAQAAAAAAEAKAQAEAVKAKAAEEAQAAAAAAEAKAQAEAHAAAAAAEAQAAAAAAEAKAQAEAVKAKAAAEAQAAAAAAQAKAAAEEAAKAVAAAVPAAAAVASAAPAAAESAGAITSAAVKELREKSGAGMMDCKKALVENGGDMEAASDWLRKKGLASAAKKGARVAAEGMVGKYIHAGARTGVLLELNCETDFVARGDRFKALLDDLCMQVAANPDVQVVDTSDVDEAWKVKERELEMQKEDLLSKPEKIRSSIVDGRMAKRVNEVALLEQPFIKDTTITVGELVKRSIAELGENIKVRRFSRFNLGEGIEKKSNDFAAEVAAATAAPVAPPPKKEAVVDAAPAAAAAPAVAVSSAAVKELREKSGAGMMDCKKALIENGGDMEAASDWLRKKGLASAAKKGARVAAEGLVGSYIHAGARTGVLLELNCETDFVARGDRFKALLDDLCMQVTANPDVQVVDTSDVDEAWKVKERELEMQKEDLLSKPEKIRSSIVDGRMAKRVNEVALLEQPFIKDTTITVGELVKRSIAELGENIKVRRFSRFNLGEGIEKKSNDFAAEVAAITGK